MLIESSPSPQAATVPNTTMFDVVSGAGRSYRIRVAFPWPEDAIVGTRMLTGVDPAILYVIDSQEHFGFVTDLARQLQFSGELPPCYVVGIGYPDEDLEYFSSRRTDELTPSEYQPPWSEPRSSGSASTFLDFLLRELKPHVEATYGLQGSESTLIGHSFGGLFALFAACEEPSAFSSYCALSPSLYWDDSLVLRRLSEVLRASPSLPPWPQLYIAVGGEEEDLSSRDSADISNRAAMVSNVLRLRDVVLQNQGDLGRSAFQVFAGETHSSIVAASMVPALRFLHSR